jgi:hypothetical protein
MRFAEMPEAAELLFQLACAAGQKAAEMVMEEKLQRDGGTEGTMDISDIVATVVNAAFEDAGARIGDLVKARDVPFPSGSVLHHAYGMAVSDVGHLLGACPIHKGDVIKLRRAATN